MDKRIREETGLPVCIADDPLSSVVLRTAKLHDDFDCCVVSAQVHFGVASTAKRDQIRLRIVSGLAPKFHVMDFQVGHRAAGLARPAIPTQDLMAKPVIGLRIKPQAGAFWLDALHDAFCAKWSRNAFFSSPGKNLKNRNTDCRRTCELPLSRFAPARKSAQIISKQ